MALEVSLIETGIGTMESAIRSEVVATQPVQNKTSVLKELELVETGIGLE